MTLSDAIDEFNAYRTSAGYAKNTIVAGRDTLRRFLACVGNVQLRSLGAHHGEMFLAWMHGKGYKPATINLQVSMLSRFFKWARDRRLMGANQNPLATTPYQKVPERARRRVPVKDFTRLLDAAEAPQERVLLALGLYLFLRSSEVVRLKVGDVDLDAGEVRVFQPKTKQMDVMPICAELDTELRAWMTWYTRDQDAPLEAGWYLVPSRKPRRIGEEITGPDLRPERQMSNTSLKVQRALRAIGWDVTGDDGEGMHTLRRSGARAWFDELAAHSRDDALRKVASMLHHKSVLQTEHYLGLDVDKEKRDDLLRGTPMFSAPDRENVVALERDLRAVSEG